MKPTGELLAYNPATHQLVSLHVPDTGIYQMKTENLLVVLYPQSPNIQLLIFHHKAGLFLDSVG
jgi:hypothetical protein